MLRRSVAIALLMLLASPPGVAAPAEGPQIARPALAEPTLSPDGRELAFVSGGDIWVGPATGGVAHLLVSRNGTSSRPMYSPDGRELAFVSTATGHGDLDVLDLHDGTIRQLTHDDRFFAFDGWSRDGTTLYFDSIGHQVGNTPNIMRVAARGGTPTIVFRERYVASSQAAPQPGTSAIAFVDGGFPQWWRRGHSHIDESAIALYRPGADRIPQLTRVTRGNAVEHWPMWSHGGDELYFVSDASGAANLYRRSTADGAIRRLTDFADDRLVFPTIAYDGSAIVFERHFGIWRYDVGTGKARALAFDLEGAPTQTDGQHVRLDSHFGELALSPDGKKLAFTAHGQIFAVAARDGGEAARITATSANEHDIVWAPDSRRIAFSSDRDGRSAIVIVDVLSGDETRVSPAEDDYAPAFSPDGKELAYVHERHEVRIVDLTSRRARTIARGDLEPDAPFGEAHELAFSPDGASLAFAAAVARGFVVIDVVPVAGGPARAIDTLANANTKGATWEPDGKRIFFSTGQRTEPGQIAAIDLVPLPPVFREDEFRKLFNGPPRPQTFATKTPDTVPDAPSSKPQPIAIDFDGIRERASLLPTGIDADEIGIAADGKTLYFTGSAGGSSNLYSFPIDPLAKEPPVAKQLTASAGEKSDLNIAADGTLYYLEDGRIGVVTPDGRTHGLGVSAELEIDFAREKLEIFDQAWRTLDRYYADPHFNGVDWDGVRAEYEPYVRAAHNRTELVRLLNLMVGELNSSHSGVRSAFDPAARRSGYLGAEFDATAYMTSHRLRFAEITPLGPVALTGRIHAGDELEAIDGTSLLGDANVEALLEDRIGKRVVLRVNGHDIPVAPVDANTAGGLAYRAWVASRRAFVERRSGGRLGYVHLYDMGEASLRRLTIDLDTENQAKDGVIVDIRNNNGGFVDPYVTDIFTRRNYVVFRERGRGGALLPERPSLGQRSLDRPTALLVNANSLSDAENFTEDYRRARLGPIVGEPTAGWIIFTSSFTMIDGSQIRVPFVQTLTLDGENMERHPRPVDRFARHRLGEDFVGDDTPLAAATTALLREVRRHRTATP